MATSSTLHFGHALLTDGWHTDVRIEIAGGRIASIVSGAERARDDDGHAIVLPGMPNLHSHAFQRGMAGLAETSGPAGDSFWTWRDTMYQFVDRIDPEGLHAIAAMAFIEMLEGGFTRVGEFHYLHHDRSGRAYADPAIMARAIVEAATDTGIALTLLPVFYAYADFGGLAPHDGQRRFVHDLSGFGRLIEALEPAMAALPDGVLGLAPHSLRAVVPAELAALARLLPDRPCHIHVAEQVREVDACVAWSGARPVEWLLANADVTERWCCVHATHMTAGETETLAQSGAVAGLCPITEANLGDGIFPARRYLGAGGRFGIGSDSNVLIDPTEELRLLEYGQRLIHRERNVLAGGERSSTGMYLYQSALAGGSQALGAAAGIAIGHPADLVSLDARHPAIEGRSPRHLIDAFIFVGGRAAIDRVWRGGAEVVRAGVHRDRARVAERYRRACAAMLD